MPYLCGSARTAFEPHAFRSGGRGGIRTHGWFNPTLDFESSALDRTQPPFLFLNRSRELATKRKKLSLKPKIRQGERRYSTTGNGSTAAVARNGAKVSSARCGIVATTQARSVNRNVTVNNHWRSSQFSGQNHAACRNYSHKDLMSLNRRSMHLWVQSECPCLSDRQNAGRA